MSSPFIGQITQVGFNFAPVNHAFCDGQLLSIASNTALFSLLGTTYGGNGQTTFALPDLRGRAPVHMGTGPGLSTQVIGEVNGTETVQLISSELPQHNHLWNGYAGPGPSRSAANGLLGGESQNKTSFYAPSSNSNLNPQSIGFTGGNLPHDNMQPYLVVNYIITLFGIFPSRN